MEPIPNLNADTASPQKQPALSAHGRTDSHSITKRLQSELMSLMLANPHGISAFPEDGNMLCWMATLIGPPQCVYEGLTYKISLKFPPSYPYTSPTVRFETPCFHPNVDQAGNICLDILKEKWSAVYSVQTILLSIQSLLAEPNNASPLNGFAASLWKNQEDYKRVLLERYQEDVKKEKQ